MEDLRIYVASLSDYNNGRLEGKWLDLSDYSDASELMEAIQEMLDELTEKYKSVDGEVREEWAVHDYEGIPSTMASEYMGEQDFQQIYDIAEVADESGVPFEVLIERAGDTGSDDYKALAESLMFIVQGNDESDIVHEYEDQIGELGSDFWSNHIYIDDVTERVIYGEDVDRFREDILYENPDMDEDEAERQAEEMADEEAERREDLTTYLEDMGYGDEIPSFVTKDYDEAWKHSMSYDFDVIYHDEKMYVFSNNYSLGGNILSGMIGAYIGYKIGRARPQKKGFSTEKKIGRKIKGALSKKKMERGGQTMGLITDEQVNDLSFDVNVETIPRKNGVLLHEIVTIKEFDLYDESNINFYPFHLIYGSSSLAIFDALGVDEVAGLTRKDCEEFINDLKSKGKTERDDAFIAGLVNYSGDNLFMFFNVERLSYQGFSNRVLPHEALHLSRNLITLLKNDWLRKNLNKPNWWEDKRAFFVDMNSDNEEFFAETLERTTAIATNGWFRVTGQKCIVDKAKKFAGGGGVHTMPDGRVMLNSAHYEEGGVISEIKRKYQTAGSDSNGVYTYSKSTADEIARKYDGDVQEYGSNWYVYLGSMYSEGGGISGLNDLIRG
jgi:antirestriction protein